MPDNGDSNSRITLAVLATKLDYLIAQVDSVCKEVKSAEAERDVIDKRVAKLEERVGIWAGFQATLSVVLSAISAWLGVRD